MVAEGGRRTRSQGRAAATVTAPPLPPPAPPPAEAPPLPPDLAAPLRRLRPHHPHRPTAAAEVAAGTAVSARGGRQIGAGRKTSEATASQEGVAEEGGTRKDPRRGGRGGARKGRADRPGAIGSIKIETGRTRDANLFLVQPSQGKAEGHRRFIT